MIKLSNGGEVLAAVILPASSGLKPNGLVLAQYRPNEWATWSIYWDGETTGDDQGQTHELWECETGHYFQQGLAYPNARSMAEYDFGLRLRRLLSETTNRALQVESDTRGLAYND